MSPSLPASLFRVTDEGDRTTVQFAGRTVLTEENAAAFDALAGLVQNRQQPELAIDLTEVEFLSSIALAKFIGLHRVVRAAGGRLSLVNPRPMVRQVFTVARLDTVLDIGPA